MIKKTSGTEIRALARHIGMSAQKSRRVIDQIRACYPIFKLVYSTAANASHNRGLKEADLFISKAEVNEGVIIKRLKPRARGCSYPIKRPTCHITIKINPLGFRLGTIQSHRSFWFAQPKNYSKGLQEDEKIRDCIKNYVQKHMRISSDFEGISRIDIKKRIDLIQINVQKCFHSVNQRLNIAIARVARAYGQPNILAEYIALQLKNRVSFRKAIKKAIELAEQADAKEIQVQIVGRLNGNEIARIEWIREGRVPLQTIRVNIDYCSYPVRTIYEVLGIKIWIFLDEE
ncbi:unnamed protein product [Victoria cruziana]